ncbi:MAG: ankyrin repeat domain-containing protein [Candidatus Cardinium sp.]|nr:ankyrin repeat domain-containing protein [Candidatus Cardinium sp.]
MIPIKALIKGGGAEANQKDNKGRAPLYVAAFKGYVNCIKALIKGGADVNQRDDKRRSALHLAAYKGHTT